MCTWALTLWGSGDPGDREVSLGMESERQTRISQAEGHLYAVGFSVRRVTYCINCSGKLGSHRNGDKAHVPGGEKTGDKSEQWRKVKPLMCSEQGSDTVGRFSKTTLASD